LSTGEIHDRRRTLLAHDEPAVANVIGSCYIMTSRPTSSSTSYDFADTAGCYAKGARLPLTWCRVALWCGYEVLAP
jgi:hypothetical protein